MKAQCITNILGQFTHHIFDDMTRLKTVWLNVSHQLSQKLRSITILD